MTTNETPPQDGEAQTELIARIIDPENFRRKDETLAGRNPGWAVEDVQHFCASAMDKAHDILTLLAAAPVHPNAQTDGEGRANLVAVKFDAECGCPEETWEIPGLGEVNMHLAAGKPSNAHADAGDEGEWEVEVTAATVDLARAAIFGWAATLPPQGQPKPGYALVPVDPTEAMLTAVESVNFGTDDERAMGCNVWNAMLYAAPKPPAEQGQPKPVEAGGWIVTSGDGKRFRTWKDGWSDWTEDREQACRYARRQDAEAVHAEDEDAWCIVQYAPTPATTEAGGDLIDRGALKRKFDDLVFAAGKCWGAGSVEHNLIRDITDIVDRLPSAALASSPL